MNEREQAAGLAPTPGYRYAEPVAGQLFVAGQVPLDSSGTLVGPSDAGAQAQQCLANLFTLVELHGYERGHIRHLRIYVAGDRSAMLGAWTAVTESFANDVPPATLLAVSGLGYEEQLVEIDASVVRD